MAAGDLHIFDQFLEGEGDGTHDLDADTIKVALIDSTQTPAENAADPCWGAGGTVNYNTDEVAAGGNYTAEGDDISGTWSQTAGTGTFDATNVTWSQHASNPTDARWAIVYNDTAVNKNCIGYMDLGAVIDMTAGDLTLTWNASGIFTKTSTAGT